MVRCVRNLTSMACVAVEVRVRALAGHNGLKDVALPRQWCRLELRLRFGHWT